MTLEGYPLASPKTAGQLWLTAAGMWPSTTSGCAPPTLTEQATNHQNLYLLDFADGVTSYAEANVAMPSDWNAGTLTASFYWLASAAVSQAVLWGVQARSYGDGDGIDAAWGTAQTVNDAATGTANQLRISAATAAVTAAGTPAASELVCFRIERVGGDASDTLVSAARLVGVMVGYGRA